MACGGIANSGGVVTEIAVAGGSILMEGDEGEEVPQNVNKVEIYSVQARTWRSASTYL